jgi:ferritin-like protein
MSQPQQTGKAIQSTINQIVKKPLKEEADDLVAMFFYTSAIPFNCIGLHVPLIALI